MLTTWSAVLCCALVLDLGPATANLRPPYMGVRFMAATIDGVTGIRLTSVMPDSPAAVAKLAANDFIVLVDGEPCTDTSALRQKIRSSLPGKVLTLTVLRNGERKIVPVFLIETPPFDPEAAALDPPRSSGFTVRGTGTVTGDMTNTGNIVLADPPMEVEGNFTQEWMGVLDIELSTNHQGPYVTVDGHATLSGILYVHSEELTPKPGSRFELISGAKSIKGRFGKAMLPTLPDGLRWKLEYDDIGRQHDIDGDGKCDVTLIVVAKS